MAWITRFIRNKIVLLCASGSPQHCTVNLNTHPVKNKVALFTATQNIGDWAGLCTYLGASDSIMDGLKYSTAQDIIKKQECLTDVFNNFRLDWERVVRVVANYPISNSREACNIAKIYIGMEERECLYIISAHRSSKENVRGCGTGIYL